MFNTILKVVLKNSAHYAYNRLWWPKTKISF